MVRKPPETWAHSLMRTLVMHRSQYYGKTGTIIDRPFGRVSRETVAVRGATNFDVLRAQYK